MILDHTPVLMQRTAQAGQVQQQPCQEPQPLQLSFDRFRAILGPEEQRQFRQTKLQDVLFEVERLEKKQATSSRTRRIKSRIEPFLTFLDRYTRAVDSLAQANAFPSSLIWGLVKILLVIASAHSRYLEKLIEATEEISDKVSLYSEYENLFKDETRFKIALADVYFDVLVFLHKAKTIFSRRGFWLLRRNCWRTFELDFRDTLRALSRHTKVLESEIALSCTNQIIEVRKQLPGLRRDVSCWLHATDTQDDFLRESKRRTSPCGQWLLDHELFKQWHKSTDDRILWIIGSPGSGKTVLSTSIIEHIESGSEPGGRRPVAFFYCSQNSPQRRTTISILATLIAQIGAYFEQLPTVLLESYNKSMKSARPRFSMADQPLFVIKSLCGLLEEVFIVIDGLDEAQDPDDVLQTIFAISEMSANTRTLILSRDLPRISKNFSPHRVLRIRSEDMKSDIDMFVRDQLSKLDFVDAELYQTILAKVSEGAGGVFLWATLVLQSLKSATSTCNAIEIVSTHPLGLNLTYNSILQSFKARSPEVQKLSKKVLTWICCAARPVKWDELIAALVADTAEEGDIRDAVPFQSVIADVCSPLVEYLPDQDIFRLVHISVREFLLSATDGFSADKHDELALPFREVDGHLHLAKACLKHLLQSMVKINSEVGRILSPLSEYSMSFWAYHLIRSRYDSDLDRMMQSYLSCRRRRLSWISHQLFRETLTFPLQHLVRMQKQLSKWASSASTGHEDRLDWIQDVEHILLDIDNIEVQQSTDSEVDVNHWGKITHFERLMVVRDLCREYTMNNSLDQGETWMTNALQNKEESVTQDKLSTVWLLNSLGLIYDQQQKVELAAATQEKALAIQEIRLGTTHLDTLWTVNELGRMYRHLMRTQDSIKMHSRALEVLRISGDDLQVAWTLNTLARAYRQQGDAVTAISLHEEAIAIQAKLLGSDHPHVLWATADIGRCYRDQGRMSESAQYHRVCLNGRKRVLGVDHLDTLWAMNDLGLVLEETNKIEASKFHQQALAGQTLILGASHRHPIWSRSRVEELEAGMISSDAA